MYAGDIQLYLSVHRDAATTAAARINLRLVNIEEWLRASRLRLNPNKTQTVFLESAQQLGKVGVQSRLTCSHLKLKSNYLDNRNLGVFFNSQLSVLV